VVAREEHPSIEHGLSLAVEGWLAEDPDPATRLALVKLRDRSRDGDAAALAELRDAFSGPLTFGTAGLRGPLGPGPARMNRVVVSRAAAGLAHYLVARGLTGARVIIGFDARHDSDVFAADTAAIMAGAGLVPLLCSRALPTPVVAFGIRHFRCAAGVVVTASHNPAQDNGYKVYLGDGSQIIPPADAEIADQIAAIGPLAAIPRGERHRSVGDDLVEAYLARACSLIPAGAPRELHWTYTALHGVGAAIVRSAVHRCGFPQPAEVAVQMEPDPTFPTLPFPNPEEPGAMDLAISLAAGAGADIAIANDPDADRCAVAAPIDGRWRMLSGDELGWLLAETALRAGVRGTYACSIVSSTLLSRMAAAHGQAFESTLTGFKWIGRVPNLAFGYEEAIGYCTDPAAVPDKDGITALLRVLALVAELKAAGRTVAGLLDDIAHRYGVHVTSQLSYRVRDLALISSAMERLRADPPTTLSGDATRYEDLAEAAGELPPTDAVLIAGERVRAIVRPSGTEPKLKCYLQVSLPVEESQDLAAAREVAGAVMARARADLAGALGLGSGVAVPAGERPTEGRSPASE
jgi:phosphomannomutase